MSKLEDAAATYGYIRHAGEDIDAEYRAFKAGALWLLEEAGKLSDSEEFGPPTVLLLDLEVLCKTEREK